MDVRQALVTAVRCCLRGTQTGWPVDALTEQDWEALWALAREQQVLPMVLQGVYTTPAFLNQPSAMRAALQRESRTRVAYGAMRASSLAMLWQQLRQAQFTPVIMKGAACRSVYAVSGVRQSSDEDILVPSDQFWDCVAFLKEQGFTCGEAVEDAFEVGLRRNDGLYIELHRTPFAPDDPVLSGCNAWFDGLWDRCMTIDADGAELQVMGPDDHMLLLILHAFKHLLFSGFGLRQVCDVVLWAERDGQQIHWQSIVERCRAVRALGFARAVFGIGAKYLAMDTQKACLPEELLCDDGTAELLLHDLLSGGVFGTASRSRHHSATVTRNAVAADRAGEKSSLLQSLFPPARQLEGQYPYLKKTPWLLPLAWGSRMGSYGLELLRRRDSSAAETLQIARERMELLRKLDIMD